MGLNIQQSHKGSCHVGHLWPPTKLPLEWSAWLVCTYKPGLMPLAVNLHVITKHLHDQLLEVLHAAHHTTWLASNCPNCSQLPWTSILTHYSYCYCSWNIELCLGFDETPPTVGVSTYISVGTSSIQEIDSNSFDRYIYTHMYLVLALLQYICSLTEPLFASAGAGVYSSENITT